MDRPRDIELLQRLVEGEFYLLQNGKITGPVEYEPFTMEGKIVYLEGADDEAVSQNPDDYVFVYDQ